MISGLALFISIPLLVVALVLAICNWFIKVKKVNLLISFEIILLATISGVLYYYAGDMVTVVILAVAVLGQVLFAGSKILNGKKEG